MPGGRRCASAVWRRAAREIDRAALGDPANLHDVNACTTRLRLIVRAQDTVDAQALKRLGAVGIVRPAANALQVIVGPTAKLLAGEIRETLASLPDTPAAAVVGAEPSTPGPLDAPVTPAPQAAALKRPIIEKLLAALGGSANLRAVESLGSRLRVSVLDVAGVDSVAIGHLGLRGAAAVGPDCVHVIVGPAAQSACAALRELIGSPAR